MAMVRLTLRNVAANRLRFVLTTFAVFLGVSFVVASLVLTDGLLDTFDQIVEDANAGIDVQVRASDEFAETQFTDRPIDIALLDEVRAVDGVAEAEPLIQVLNPRPLNGTGPGAELIETPGPVLSFNWTDTELDGVDLVEGEAPDEPGEFAIDVGAADNEGLVVGEQYDVVGGNQGLETYTLVGTARFGNENSLGGAILVFYTLEDIQRLAGLEGQAQYINVSGESGTDREELIARLNESLPADVEAVSGDQVTEEDQDDFSEIITIFGNVLLGFAAVAVFVSTFIIGNTFNILLGRRVRQLALLRALGASTGQVRASSLFEALIIGVTASVLGIGGGILLALALSALMSALGFDLPDFGVIIAPRTIIVALLVGVVVTLMASFSPARRAATVPPVAAMRAGFRFGSGEGTRRTIIAIVLAVVGASLLGYGLFGNPGGAGLLLGLGLGAVLVFVAVSLFAPLFSTPSARFLGAPLEHLPGGSITGHMARENAGRDNKRTARTASGLMIGLALIAMATVVATSLKESFKAELGSTLTADFLVTEQADLEFTSQLAPQIAALPEFSETSAVRYGTVRIDGDEKDLTALDVTVLTDLLAVDVSSGDPADAADESSIVLHRDVADDFGVEVGDELPTEFAASGEQPLVVRAIYENEFLVGNYIVDLAVWDANFDLAADNVVVMKTADGVDESTAAASLAPFEQEYPQLQFETSDEFRDRLEGQLDSLLIIINVFLGLAIVIALLGIANTMALSVLERTQEIGLMRAIGMSRGQTRGMIALEAGVVSLFGALLGVVVGIAFGWLAVTAIPDTVIDRLSVPIPTLVIYVAIATIAGLLAALVPARRAARLDILEAISTV